MRDVGARIQHVISDGLAPGPRAWALVERADGGTYSVDLPASGDLTDVLDPGDRVVAASANLLRFE